MSEYDHRSDAERDAENYERTPDPVVDAKPGGKSSREAAEVSEDELERRRHDEPATAHLPDESIRGMGLTTHPRYRE